MLQSGRRSEFFHRLFLLVGQRLGNNHVHLDDLISDTFPFLDTVSANAKLRATLCARRDSEVHFLTIHCFCRHLGA